MPTGRLDYPGLPKPRHRRRPANERYADNAGLAIPKPGMRLRDPQAIADASKGICERCKTTAGPFSVHHVKSRGAGGHDIARGPGANLINLCDGGRPGTCHDLAHRGRIPRAELLALIALREALE